MCACLCKEAEEQKKNVHANVNENVMCMLHDAHNSISIHIQTAAQANEYILHSICSQRIWLTNRFSCGVGNKRTCINVATSIAKGRTRGRGREIEK